MFVIILALFFIIFFLIYNVFTFLKLEMINNQTLSILCVQSVYNDLNLYSLK